MTELAADVFAYGLAAGLSGSAFLATVILLATEAGARSAAGLLAGVVLVLAAAALLAAVAADIVVGAGGSLVVATLLKLGLGVVLLNLAWRVRPGSEAGPALKTKLTGMEAKLAHIGPSQAVRVGIGVAVLPKRFVTTLLAGATIGAVQTTVGQSLALLTLYLLAATALIWTTLLVYIFGGDRVRAALEHARGWVMEQAEPLTFVVALGFGVLFTGQALIELLL